MNKVFIKIMFLIIFCLSFGIESFAASNDDINEIYKEQYKMSKADKLIESLPYDTQNTLEHLAVQENDWNALLKLTPENIFSEVILIAKNKVNTPFKAVRTIFAIMLLCAILEGMKLSFEEKTLSEITGVVGTLCICTTIIFPIVKFIQNTSQVINNSAKFMLCYVPIMTGIMATTGQVTSATSYHMLMMGAGEIIAQISSNILMPILNMFLAISVVSSISNKMNFSGICSIFNKSTKWILGLSMSIFISLLTMQSVISTASDNLATKGAKFAISSCVPVVGSAISDGFNTIQGCLKLLKSGVGAFGIIAAGIIFLPVIIECLIWLISLNICVAVGDVFELKQISKLLKEVCKVISTIFAIVICCVLILIVCTALLLIIGGQN